MLEKSKMTLTATQLVRLCGRYYPDELVAKCLGKDKPDDLMAQFIAAEIQSTREETASSPAQICTAIEVLTMAKQDLDTMLQGLTADLVETILRDFLAWASTRNRFIGPALLEGWIAVHEDDVVRQYQGLVHGRFKELFPEKFIGGIRLPAENVETVLASLEQSLTIPEDAAPEITVKIP